MCVCVCVCVCVFSCLQYSSACIRESHVASVFFLWRQQPFFGRRIVCVAALYFPVIWAVPVCPGGLLTVCPDNGSAASACHSRFLTRAHRGCRNSKITSALKVDWERNNMSFVRAYGIQREGTCLYMRVHLFLRV